MKPLIQKWIMAVLIAFAIMFQYACNEPQTIEQQTKTRNSSRLSLVNLTGAIFTTDATCSGVNVNIYENKEDVYLDGGPSHPGAAGLPDGDYYCKITDPDGTLLGTSVGSGNETPIHVTNGEFAQCYQLWTYLIKASDNNQGYDNTGNAGGEYKVWVSSVSTFDESLSKTDNFKVTGGSTPPPSAQLHVIKFYDANANGSNDDGILNLLTGWQVYISGGIITAYYYTPVDLVMDPGTYIVTESDPIETYWHHTTAASVPVNLANGDNTTVAFGNVCLGAGGGLTLGFWSNKNGTAIITSTGLSTLNGLNLVWGNGNPYTPATKDFRAWLLGATATNMAYMLSAQLAAMKLNVFNGKVSPTALVYAPGVDEATNGFITIENLIAAAAKSLGNYPLTIGSSEARTDQEALKNALDNANNNKTFVQPTPCPYTFL